MSWAVQVVSDIKTTSSCQSLSPTDLLLYQGTQGLPVGHAHYIIFVLLLMFSSSWLFRVKKQIGLTEFDLILATTAVRLKLNPSVLGTMIL